MHFLKNHKTSLAAEEMQLICPTSEFKVGHLPFQGKVKGILPRWGRSKSSATTRADSNFAVLSPDFLSFLSFPRKKRVIGQNVLVKIYIMLVLRAEYGAY